MSSSYDNDTQNETEQDSGEFYGVRDGTLFLIDASPDMFNEDEDNKTPFVKYIEEYIYILKQKLVWNRQDWMGLVLFATEKWDTDPEIKNILTLQKFSLINIDKLKEAEKICDGTWKDYRGISSSTSYPLHDVLWHAAQIFSSVKLTMSARRVILYTCHDVPPLTDENEKHRIRAKAATYNDIGLRLYVVGMEDNWNFELFYKDLEMLSRNISKEDYKRVSYKNLVQQVKRPARNMAKLPWRIGQDVTINVDVFNVVANSEYLKKVRMSSETNAPLVTYTHFRRQDAAEEMEEEDKEEEDEDEKQIIMSVPESDLRKMQEWGGEKIYFTLDEVKNLNKIYETGIDILEVKPLSCDPMYHIHSPYFISCNKNCTKGEKLLFAGLLHKCEEQNLMITCRVTLRSNSGTFLYNMLPISSEGGFYLYKMPYEENVYDFPKDSDQYVYNNEDKKPPINDEAVHLFKKIIKRTQTIYDPETFPNPKLQVKLQSLETLALDLDTQDPPPDSTLPMEDILQERIGGLTKKLQDLFTQESESDPPPTKKVKKSDKGGKSSVPICDKDIIELVEQKKLDRLKVSDLQVFLRDAGLSTSGRKAELISRLYNHYTNDQVKDESI